MRFEAGVQTWSGDATLRSPVRKGAVLPGINASAAPGVVLRGQWLFKEGSAGAWHATSHEHAAPQGSEPCILIWGGPWLLDQSQVCSVGGVAVMCSDAAAAMLRRCEVGGGRGESAAQQPSAWGAPAAASWRNVLYNTLAQTWGGAGVRALEQGKCSLERSTVQHCSYCIAVHGGSRVIVRSSALLNARFSALYADCGSQGATLLLQKSSVLCRLWYTRERAGRFETKECSLVDAN